MASCTVSGPARAATSGEGNNECNDVGGQGQQSEGLVIQGSEMSQCSGGPGGVFMMTGGAGGPGPGPYGPAPASSSSCAAAAVQSHQRRATMGDLFGQQHHQYAAAEQDSVADEGNGRRRASASVVGLVLPGAVRPFTLAATTSELSLATLRTLDSADDAETTISSSSSNNAAILHYYPPPPPPLYPLPSSPPPINSTSTVSDLPPPGSPSSPLTTSSTRAFSSSLPTPQQGFLPPPPHPHAVIQPPRRNQPDKVWLRENGHHQHSDWPSASYLCNQQAQRDRETASGYQPCPGIDADSERDPHHPSPHARLYTARYPWAYHVHPDENSGFPTTLPFHTAVHATPVVAVNPPPPPLQNYLQLLHHSQPPAQDHLPRSSRGALPSSDPSYWHPGSRPGALTTTAGSTPTTNVQTLPPLLLSLPLSPQSAAASAAAAVAGCISTSRTSPTAAMSEMAWKGPGGATRADAPVPRPPSGQDHCQERMQPQHQQQPYHQQQQPPPYHQQLPPPPQYQPYRARTMGPGASLSRPGPGDGLDGGGGGGPGGGQGGGPVPPSPSTASAPSAGLSVTTNSTPFSGSSSASSLLPTSAHHQNANTMMYPPPTLSSSSSNNCNNNTNNLQPPYYQRQIQPLSSSSQGPSPTASNTASLPPLQHHLRPKHHARQISGSSGVLETSTGSTPPGGLGNGNGNGVNASGHANDMATSMHSPLASSRGTRGTGLGGTSLSGGPPRFAGGGGEGGGGGAGDSGSSPGTNLGGGAYPGRAAQHAPPPHPSGSGGYAAVANGYMVDSSSTASADVGSQAQVSTTSHAGTAGTAPAPGQQQQQQQPQPPYSLHMPPTIVPPLPEHMEASIMQTSTTWLLSNNSNHNHQQPPPNPFSPPPTTHQPQQQQQQQQYQQHQHGQPAAYRSAAPDMTSSTSVPPPHDPLSSHNNSLPSSHHPSSNHNHHPSSSSQQPYSSSSCVLSSNNSLPAPVPPPFALANTAPPVPDPLILTNNNGSQEFPTWRLAVEPLPFSSGLEGISGLPLEIYHATSAIGAPPPPPSSADMHDDPSTWVTLTHKQIVALLERYLHEISELISPFALTPSNPCPPPPPPYLHTRISRLATMIRELLGCLEPRAQAQLDAAFTLRPPGDNEASEAEREMLMIRRRRIELQEKALAGKRDLLPVAARSRPIPGPGQPYPGSLDRRAPLAPRRPRDAWRCSSCGTTHSPSWIAGPDGARSLCENCGYHSERINRKREGGDGDFSSVPPPAPYNPHNNMVGLGP